MKPRGRAIVVLIVGILWSGHAAAQVPGVPQDRPSERSLPLPEPKPREPAPTIELPPLDLDVTPSPSALRVRVHEFRFTGNVAFTAEILAAIAEPYRGRDVGSDDLEALRIALTRHYVEHGFVNSGAVLPDQEITGGVITYRIVEGRLSGIEVHGHRRLRERYISERVALAAGPPMNAYAIRDRLFLLQQDPRIRRLDATLLPGTRPGEAILRVDVDEAPSRVAYVSVNNHRPPSVGAERAELELLDYNLLGFGDTLGIRAGLTEGSEDVDLSYSVPLNARDTALQVRYARSNSTVIEPPFDRLDIESSSQTVGAGFWYFPRKTPREELSIGYVFEQRRSQSSLLGEPFAFSPGTPPDGRVRLSVARFIQSWLMHNPERVLAARSTFSVGIDALDATVDSQTEPDGRFAAWLGQLQWVERLFVRRDELVVRVDTQLSDDPLLSLEQFSIGGARSVRGYRENQLVCDQGLFLSAEYRLPIWSNAGRGQRVQLAGFYDWGRCHNRERPTSDPEELASVGVGVRATFHPTFDFGLYYGSRRKDVGDLDGDLQDKGIHFQLRAIL